MLCSLVHIVMNNIPATFSCAYVYVHGVCTRNIFVMALFYHCIMELFPSSRVGKMDSVGCSNIPYNQSNTGPHLHICSKASSRVLILYSQWDHLHKKELFLSIYTQSVKSSKEYLTASSSLSPSSSPSPSPSSPYYPPSIPAASGNYDSYTHITQTHSLS